MVITSSVLSQAGIKGGSSPKHRWTEDELDIVRRDYDGTRRSVEMIARHLNVTYFGVKGQVQKLGIAMQKSPPWTDQEIDNLSKCVHKLSINQIAKRLHRTSNAVKIKATRLKLGLRTRDGWFTKKEVCEILGVDHKKVQAWIDNGALVASWHTGLKPQKSGMAMWHITTESLRKFIIRYSGELLGRNVDIQQIVWIVAGTMDTYKELTKGNHG